MGIGYLKDGQKVEIIEKVKTGFIVSNYTRYSGYYDEDYDGEEYEEVEENQYLVKEVFSEEPVQVYGERIEKMTKIITELNFETSKLKEEKKNLEKEIEELPKKYKHHQLFKMLDRIEEAEYFVQVHDSRYSDSPTIKIMKKDQLKSYKDMIVLKKGWYSEKYFLGNYNHDRDEVDKMLTLIPFKTNEECVKYSIDLYREYLKKYKSKTVGNIEILEKMKALNCDFTKQELEEIESIEKDKKAEKIKKDKEKLAEKERAYLMYKKEIAELKKNIQELES